MRNGNTLIHEAAIHGDADTVKFLIDRNVSLRMSRQGTWRPDPIGNIVDETNEFGFTPLHYAARYNHLEVAKVLIKAGAKVGWRDKWGRTVLHKAVRFAKDPFVNYLLTVSPELAKVEDRHGSVPADTPFRLFSTYGNKHTLI